MGLLETLSPRKGATHNTKRLGRGHGSGCGKTSGRGHKGQKARKSGGIRRGFEGGQMPLHMRLPKFGFTNPFKIQYDIVNISSLEKFTGEVDPKTLKEARLASNKPVKILGDGKLSKALTVRAHKFSKSAKSAIEAAGGTVEVLS